MLLCDIDEDVREYLFRGYILDSDLTFWIGEEKAGKGMLWSYICACVTRGWPMPPTDPEDPLIDWDQVPGPAYVITISLEEDTASDLKPRARAAGADDRYFDDFSRVKRKGQPESRFKIERDLDLLGKRIVELNKKALKEGVGGVRLIVMDPIMSAAASTVSFNQQVRRNVVEPLQEFAKYYGVAILLIGHFVKGAVDAKKRGSDLTRYIGGSKGIIDACRLNCLVMRDNTDDNIRRLSVHSANGGTDVEPVEFTIEANGAYDPDAHVRFRMPPPNGPEDEERLVAACLRAMIEMRQPLGDRELATYLGLAHSMVRRAMREAHRQGRIAAQVRGKWPPPLEIAGPPVPTVPTVPGGPGWLEGAEPGKTRIEAEPEDTAYMPRFVRPAWRSRK